MASRLASQAPSRAKGGEYSPFRPFDIVVRGHFSEPKGRYAEVCRGPVCEKMELISVRVMESGEYSDLTILCEDQNFSVHKVVVCSQSKVLAAAMKKGFKVLRSSVAMVWWPR